MSHRKRHAAARPAVEPGAAWVRDPLKEGHPDGLGRPRTRTLLVVFLGRGRALRVSEAGCRVSEGGFDPPPEASWTTVGASAPKPEEAG